MSEDKAKETEIKPEEVKTEVKPAELQKPAEEPKKEEVKAVEPQKEAEAPKKEEAKSDSDGSKYSYPNKWGRVMLTSAEEVMGAQGVAALLNLSGMKDLIGNYPPDNMKKAFTFETIGKLQAGIWEMYGNRGARVFATRAGEQTFKDGLTQFKSVATAAQVAMRVGTLEGKIKLGLEFFCRFFNSVSDQVVEVSEDEKHWIWTITRCPMCWGRKSEEPCCHLGIGVLQAATAWVTEGKKFRILETECKSKGDKNCVYKIEKVPVE
jgi:predicted hydrocarbon binding protein